MLGISREARWRAEKLEGPGLGAWWWRRLRRRRRAERRRGGALLEELEDSGLLPGELRARWRVRDERGGEGNHGCARECRQFAQFFFFLEFIIVRLGVQNPI